MEKKIVLLRSIYRAARLRSSSAVTGAAAYLHLNHHLLTSRSLFSLSSASPPLRFPSDLGSRFVNGIGSVRSFSEDVAHFPEIEDPEIMRVFKDLIAESWDELPDPVLHDVKSVLSKSSDDKAGQEILKNVFRAAEAVEEFGGILMSLKMELDDAIGASGEDSGPLPDYFAQALAAAHQKYVTYLGSFGPDELYLKKKVETELGSKMIYLKMRCGGLSSEWGKVTVLGTSGLAGSYIEQRA